MSIEKKLFLDHILIQFSYGGEHQEAKPGEISGAQFSENEYLVDETGAIVGKTNNPLNGHARPLEIEKVKEILGEKFATVAAQLADTQAKLSGTIRTHQELVRDTAAEHADAIKELQNKHVEDLTARQQEYIEGGKQFLAEAAERESVIRGALNAQIKSLSAALNTAQEERAVLIDTIRKLTPAEDAEA